MNEDLPILPLALGALVLLYFGLEVERQRGKLRKVFNVFDKEESVVAEALERLVNSGQLHPYGAVVHPH
jgi:hypothetical protein